MRRPTIRTATVSVAVLALAGTTLTGCSKSINKDDMVKNIQSQMSSKMPPGSTIDCPEAPKPEVGATVRCHWTYADPTKLGMPEGTRLGATVKVTSVNGDKAQFSIENDKVLEGKDGQTIDPSTLSIPAS